VIPLLDMCDGFTFVALFLLGGIMRAYFLSLRGWFSVFPIFSSPVSLSFSLEHRE